MSQIETPPRDKPSEAWDAKELLGRGADQDRCFEELGEVLVSAHLGVVVGGGDGELTAVESDDEHHRLVHELGEPRVGKNEVFPTDCSSVSVPSFIAALPARHVVWMLGEAFCLLAGEGHVLSHLLCG